MVSPKLSAPFRAAVSGGCIFFDKTSSYGEKHCKEFWPRGAGFGYPQRGFALLKVH